MKKFIALALALAMMVSCLVFTASAESGVVVRLEGPANITAGAEFQVKIRVTDPSRLVGGVQGMIDVTGAEFKSLEANPVLKTWNNTEDETTIYKVTDNDVTFAALNSLEADSYSTRLWIIVNYKATAENVSVELKNVKAADKSANLINDVTVEYPGAVDIIDPAEDLFIDMNYVGMRTSAEANVAMKQGLVVNSKINFAGKEIDEFGVIFYPTSLLNGAELTVNTPGAVVAKAVKGDGLYNYVVNNGGEFDAVLNFKFDSDVNALRFLGTRVTVRSYYKVGEEIVYASNDSAVDSYVKSGTASKAVLNIVLDKQNDVAPVEGGVTADAFATAITGLNTNNENWQANRATALKYVVDYYASIK